MSNEISAESSASPESARDHREIGRVLDLFQFFSVAPGAAFWAPRGVLVYRLLQEAIRERLEKGGYQEVMAPLLLHNSLWKQSGHWDKFRENMFLLSDNAGQEPEYALKPMNCPAHHVFYASRKHSYRELPVRYCCQDILHRNEVSGALSGLLRLRQFSIDDAHVYLAESQLQDEIGRMVEQIDALYRQFGFFYSVSLALRPEQRLGSDELWDRAEGALREALERRGITYHESPGEGAFYGPKLEFQVFDSRGRSWQMGTVQVDYASPERFDLSYVGEDNASHRVVVIHRAFLGSFERFIAILLEHFDGALPFWLSPVQVSLVPVSDAFAPFAREVESVLREAGIRAEVDERAQPVGYRLREGILQKVPFQLVVGQKEMDSGVFPVRAREQSAAGARLSLADFAQHCVELRRSKALELGL